MNDIFELRTTGKVNYTRSPTGTFMQIIAWSILPGIRAAHGCYPFCSMIFYSISVTALHMASFTR